jgi:hypothetical protein
MVLGSGLLAVAGCGTRADEFTSTLPDRESTMVALPENGTASSGLHTGESRAALVGHPAEWYTQSYYAARDINGLGAFVIGLLEAITKYPPTTLTPNKAEWGPFNAPGEPNVWRLTITKESAALYSWSIDGRPVSENAFVSVASGKFEPKALPLGQGAFTLYFDRAHQLDPTNNGTGTITYAYDKSAQGVLVAVRAESTDAKTGQPIDVRYAFGQDDAGAGFMVFAAAVDPSTLPNGMAGSPQAFIIKTRWTKDGSGRADVVALNPANQQPGTYQLSQCWDTSYVSTYEQGQDVGVSPLYTGGNAQSCVFAQATFPSLADLPDPSNGVVNGAP